MQLLCKNRHFEYKLNLNIDVLFFYLVLFMLKKKGNIFVMGGQYGDEGKGKVVDLLAKDADGGARVGGSHNSGHTIIYKGKKIITHAIPAAFSNEEALLFMGMCMEINPKATIDEIENIINAGVQINPNRLYISDRIGLNLPHHQLIDVMYNLVLAEGKGDGIGTTGRGVGPSYTDVPWRVRITPQDVMGPNLYKVIERNTQFWSWVYAGMMYELSMSDKSEKANEIERVFMESLHFDFRGACITDFTDTMYQNYLRDWLGDKIKELQKVATFTDLPEFFDAHPDFKLLIEGHQGAELDVNYGQQPFVTSSSVHPALASISLGIPPESITNRIGIFKAYLTRVGEGDMKTEFVPYDSIRSFTREEAENMDLDEVLKRTNAGDQMALQQYIAIKGDEFGATTKRPRRCGWLNLDEAIVAARRNNMTGVVITKPDVLAGLDRIRYFKDGTYIETDGYSNFYGINQFGNLPNEFMAQVRIFSENLPDIWGISTGPKPEHYIDLRES